MTSSNITWIDYPKAEEGPNQPFVHTEEKNPVLRGIPLVLGSRLYVSIFMIVSFVFF